MRNPTKEELKLLYDALMSRSEAEVAINGATVALWRTCDVPPNTPLDEIKREWVDRDGQPLIKDDEEQPQE